MWYVRGKLRGVAIVVTLIGILGLLAGDFGEMTWYFIGGGSILWAVAGLIFRDPPSSRRAIDDLMNGKVPRAEDIEAYVDERMPLAAQYYSAEGSNDQTALGETKVPASLEVEFQGQNTNASAVSELELGELIDSLAESIAQEIAAAWHYQENLNPERTVAAEDIELAVTLASKQDERLSLGARAILSYKVKSNLRKRGFLVR